MNSSTTATATDITYDNTTTSITVSSNWSSGYINEFGERDEYVYTTRLMNFLEHILPNNNFDGEHFFNEREVEVYVKMMRIYQSLSNKR